MTNAEKILADNPILKGIDPLRLVAKINGEPRICQEIDCDDCDFSNGNCGMTGESCIGRRLSWLNSQIKEEI